MPTKWVGHSVATQRRDADEQNQDRDEETVWREDYEREPGGGFRRWDPTSQRREPTTQASVPCAGGLGAGLDDKQRL